MLDLCQLDTDYGHLRRENLDWEIPHKIWLYAVYKEFS